MPKCQPTPGVRLVWMHGKGTATCSTLIDLSVWGAFLPFQLPIYVRLPSLSLFTQSFKSILKRESACPRIAVVQLPPLSPIWFPTTTSHPSANQISGCQSPIDRIFDFFLPFFCVVSPQFLCFYVCPFLVCSGFAWVCIWLPWVCFDLP